jgi:hypothetical protein
MLRGTGSHIHTSLSNKALSSLLQFRPCHGSPGHVVLSNTGDLLGHPQATLIPKVSIDLYLGNLTHPAPPKPYACITAPLCFPFAWAMSGLPERSLLSCNSSLAPPSLAGRCPTLCETTSISFQLVPDDPASFGSSL